MEQPAEEPVVVIEPESRLARFGLPQAWEHRHLLRYLVLRDLRVRYRPAFFGRTWVVLQPCLLALLYWVIFSLLAGLDTERVPSLLFVFSGIGIFFFFRNGVSTTAGSLVNSVGTFSKVYYPRLVAPLTTVCTAAVDLLGALVIMVLLMALYGVAPGWQVVAVPAFLAAILLLTLGVGLVLASLAVNVRDVQIALPVALRFVMYASPVVYPHTQLPEAWRDLMFVNPLAAWLQGFRWALVDDLPPPLWSVLWAALVTAALLLWGLQLFARVERDLVDTV